MSNRALRLQLLSMEQIETHSLPLPLWDIKAPWMEQIETRSLPLLLWEIKPSLESVQLFFPVFRVFPLKIN